MKCPLLGVKRAWKGDTEISETTDCLREECAWWNPTEAYCRIAGIDMSLKNLTMALVKLNTIVNERGRR